MAENHNADCAAKLAAAGLVIFPCDPKKRTPLLKGWQTTSTNDAATVAGWWAQWPGAVPALDLARCGLVVLDGDRHHPGVDGVAALRELLKQQHGLDTKALPIVKTPRDGVHVYFRQCRPALGNSPGNLPKGVDVKAAGGYVIAPGAMLGNRGSYQPIAGRPNLAAAFAANSIPTVPAGIVALVRPAQRRIKGQQRRNSPVSERERAYALAALRRCADELAAVTPGSRNNALNKAAFRMGTMAARGWLSEDEIEDALSRAMGANGYLRDKGAKAIAATLASGLEAGLENPHDDPDSGGVTLDDFVAFLPAHNYIFTPCREPWPASGVDARLGKVAVTDAGGGTKNIRASTWLDIHRPVEQMTWAPGEPPLIRDRLVVHGGWIERLGVTLLNLYRPPLIIPGNATEVDLWLDHLHKIYPEDAKHILRWLAHRVQRPQEKINHALLLGGSQGIGKDSLLEPLKHAVGPWNFLEVSPQAMLGRFNGYLNLVVLRISEARDLGEFDRFKFYEHLKAYTASPPDVLRCDEKHLREHYVFNCCGVIITTNHKAGGIFLPADDRRHFVAWSTLTKKDFVASYWNRLWEWYGRNGRRHVTAYLAELDLADFDAKAPPPQTPAFWEIVDAGRSPEDAELADVLDKLKNPRAVTLAQIRQAASGDFEEWLNDRRNRPSIPHRLERCGYVPFRNSDVDGGLWIIGGALSAADRAKAAHALKD